MKSLGLIQPLKGRWAPLLVFFVVLALFSKGYLSALDNLIYRAFAAVVAPSQSASDVVLLDIDAAIIEELGPWPWDNHHFVQVVEHLKKFRPRALGLLEVTPAGTAQDLQEYLKSALKKVENVDTKRAILSALKRVDSDYRLVETAASMDALFVGLAVGQSKGEPVPESDAVAAFFLLDQQLKIAKPTTAQKLLRVSSGWLAPSPVTLNSLTNIDRALFQESGSAAPYSSSARWMRPVVFQLDDYRLPSLAVAISAFVLKLDGTDIALDGNSDLKLGDRRVSSGISLAIWPDTAHRYLRTIPLSKIISGMVKSEELENKVLLVGRLSAGYMQPVGSTIASLIDGKVLSSEPMAYWGSVAWMLALLLFWLTWVTSRPTLQWGPLLLAFVLSLPLLLWWMATFLQLWLPLSAPLTLTAGLLLLKLGPLLTLGHRDLQLQKTLSTVRISLALLQAESKQLDAAWKTLRKVEPTLPAVRALLRVGAYFAEQQRRADARRIYQHILKIKPGHREATRRLRAQETDRLKVIAAQATQVSTHPAILLARPERLGRFKVESEIGRGAMAVVYKALDDRLDRPVAIKAIPLEDNSANAHSRDVKRRFFREAKAAGRLNHPDIVTVFDVGEDNGLAYIAMDYLVGEDLSTKIKSRQRLPLKVVLDIGARVAEALHYAHENGVVHRDVKPANIIFDTQGNKITVTDFGVACLVDSSKTKTGTVLGSPSYMSPEQISGKHVDGRADLFSLGVSIFQLLSGKLPFVGDSLANVMYKITRGEAQKLEPYCPTLPLEVIQLVEKSIDSRISKRFQSGREMAEAIRQCMQKIDKA